MAQWRSGCVARWHCNPDLARCGDTVAAHHGRCGMLVMTLWPDCSRELLMAAITHDAGESVVGDLPSPFKDAAPNIAAQHAMIERDALEGMGLAVALTEASAERLRFVDRLDAYLFAAMHAPHVLDRGGLPEAGQWLWGMSWRLGVADQVKPMLAGVRDAA